MKQQLQITSERVDDIPLLLAQQDRMEVSSLLDKHFIPNGNWKGLSLGAVTSVWLSHILSEGDHRLNHVEPWASHRLETLSGCISEPVRSLDFSDNRLALILRELSDDSQWDNFESEFAPHLLRVYDLFPQEGMEAPFRLDSSASSRYWKVTEDGLFQFGHSKDHRPDLPQVKVMLSTLDPLVLPIGCEVVSGERADDGLYIPAVRKIRQIFPDKKGLLFIGDSKLASTENRGFIALGEDFYLCPLPKAQLSEERTLAGLYAGNPKRKTAHPTTEQVLEVFRYITLTIIHQHNQTLYHLTELNRLQTTILELLNFSVNIYTQLAAQFENPVKKERTGSPCFKIFRYSSFAITLSIYPLSLPQKILFI